MERGVVARHEVGHAIVGTAVARLLEGQPEVEVHKNRALWNFFFQLNFFS